MIDLHQKLSPHFKLIEFVKTNLDQYQQQNIDHLEEEHIAKLKILCITILEPIRQNWGALKITSGFRNFWLNAAVGGSETSQHLTAEAADFIPLMYSAGCELRKVFDWIVGYSGLKYGQVIMEKNIWIHISLSEPYRIAGKCQQALNYIEKNGKRIYAPYEICAEKPTATSVFDLL